VELAQGGLQLTILDEAVPRIVKRVKCCIDILPRRVVPERSDSLAERHLVEIPVAVVIPLAEQVDQLHLVQSKDLVELVGDAHAR